MDRLISEKQVLDTIADFIKNNYSVAKLILNINAIPSADPYKGITNGEVIKSLFPYGRVLNKDECIGFEIIFDDRTSYCSSFDGIWWDSPYEPQESEG